MSFRDKETERKQKGEVREKRGGKLQLEERDVRERRRVFEKKERERQIEKRDRLQH